MKNKNVFIKFEVIAINSKEAEKLVTDQLEKKTMLLDNWEVIHTDEEVIKEYKIHEIFIKFNLVAKSKEEAEEIVLVEMAKETMPLRNWEIVKHEKRKVL